MLGVHEDVCVGSCSQQQMTWCALLVPSYEQITHSEEITAVDSEVDSVRMNLVVSVDSVRMNLVVSRLFVALFDLSLAVSSCSQVSVNVLASPLLWWGVDCCCNGACGHWKSCAVALYPGLIIHP